jgi:hypothetical protein
VAPQIPVPIFRGNEVILVSPGNDLVAEVQSYDDEMFAYLMTSYLRGTRTFANWDVLLTARQSAGHVVYPIVARYRGDDLLSGLYTLYSAETRGLIRYGDWRLAAPDLVRGFRRQDQVFEVAYRFPIRRRLESLSRAELVRYAERFVRFKSSSDPRTWHRGVATLEPLTSAKSKELSEEIVAVARFYAIPLDFFMGIGAMENNYLNAPGDIQHTVWKRRALAGDRVVKREGGRVLVSNSSIGVWQITRETLRYAHRLYLSNRRDYSQLPPELRPPRMLNLDAVDPRVLTTYAGLLFRDLLDRCGGNVDTAVGAYNGGLTNPSLLYATGVRAAAIYARDFIEHAAALGEPVTQMQFLSAPAR